MPTIKKRYVVDQNNRRVGVLLDLPTFQKIEELVEDRLLGSLLGNAAKDKPMSLQKARRRYARLKKHR